MSKSLVSLSLAAGLVLAAPIAAQAQIVVTQWNFNASTTTPSVGAGAASLVGGTTATFASGAANGGSTDPQGTTGNFGWNLSTFPAATAGNLSAGAQFAVSTLGQSGIVVSWDQRHSNTSSAVVQFQYSTNGTTFTNFGMPFIASAGDTWFNNRTVDLSGVAGVSNNASFAFRIVSSFAPAAGGYVASTTGSSYATTGTWRFDMVTVSAVPEPTTTALLLAGLAAVGLLARRRA